VQARGDGDPVTGGVVILDAGDNKHANGLADLVGRVTDAAGILAAVRRDIPGCVSVVNKSILVAEAGAGESSGG
jgi:hypothetical protein